MCNTCQISHIKFVVPLTTPEVLGMCTPCQECGIDGIDISLVGFPSLIKGWRLLKDGEKARDPVQNVDYYVRITV